MESSSHLVTHIKVRTLL